MPENNEDNSSMQFLSGQHKSDDIPYELQQKPYVQGDDFDIAWNLFLSKDHPFFIDTFRALLKKYEKQEVSLSYFVHKLNLAAYKWSKSGQSTPPHPEGQQPGVEEMANAKYPYPENDLYKESDPDLQQMIWHVDRLREAFLAGHAAALSASSVEKEDAVDYSFGVEILKELVGSTEVVGDDIASLQYRAKRFLKSIE